MSAEDYVAEAILRRNALRLYTDAECEAGRDGYPPEWNRIADLEHGIKDIVRGEAGNRCVRCNHPYEKGAGEWSRCDTSCQHFTLKDGWGERRIIMADRTVVPELAGLDIRYRLHGAPFLVKVGGDTKPPGFGEIDRIEARWRILTVHHLDGRKGNCRWWNLAALCQRCHLQIQGKVKMERVWPWEHSTWFQPYVAGYYAFVYLGQELERAEVESRLDGLLALERMA